MRVWWGTFAANGLIFGAGLLSSILAARLLGVDDRGLLAAIIFWPHLLAGLAAMGLNESIVVHSARNGTAPSLRSTALTASLLLAAVVAIPAVLAMPTLLGAGRQEFIIFAQVYVATFLPLTFIAQNLLAVEQGEQRFRRFNVQRIIQAAVYPILLAAFWFMGVLDVRTAAIGVLSGTALVAFLRIWQSRRNLLELPRAEEGLEVLREGYRIHGVNLISHLNTHLDKLALVVFATDHQLGLYVVALAAAGASTQLLVQTYINIMLPRAAQPNRPSNHYRAARRLLLLLVVLVVSLSAILIKLMPWFILFLYGAEFADAVFPAQILLIATGAMAVKKALIYLLRSQSIHRPAVKAEALTAVMLAVTVFPAYTAWGISGVCLSMAVAQLSGVFYAILQFHQLSVKEGTSPSMRGVST